MYSSPLKNLINHKKVFFISPFTENVINGVTWRISFMRKRLESITPDIYFCYRGTSYFPSMSKNTFELSPNRFLNSLNPFFLYKIYFLNIENSVLFCNTIWSGLYGLFFFFLKWVPFVFDNHNVEFSRFKSYWSLLQYPVWFLENILLKYAAIVIVSSEADKNELESVYWVKDNTEVIENVFPSSLYPESSRNDVLNSFWVDTNKKIILFFWSMQYYPNQEALLFIKTDIVPYLDLSKCLVIVAGLDSEKFIDPNDPIVALGFVHDIDSLIAISDLVIAPLFSGAGVKIKILHALSFWKRVLTTLEWSRWIRAQENMLVAHRENFLSHINSCLSI